ncbi:hypothetical protein IH922_06855 [candidate division KSB1 bacterium]|nr:hypothetical protein [candidate division KSB1 bacterium]
MLIAAGADLSRVRHMGILRLKDERPAAVELYEHMDLIEKACRDVGAVFLAVDPISAHLGTDTDALEALDNAETITTARPLTAELSRIHYLRGSIYFPQGNIERCLEQHQLALDLAREISSPEGEARALGGLADAEYMLENKLETWQEEEDPKSERATKKFQIYLKVKETETLYNKIKQELKMLLFNNRSLITAECGA